MTESETSDSESEPAGPETNSGAVILQFPARPIPPEARLQRSVQALMQAIESQRAAVAEWRRATEDLSTVIKSIGANLGRLDQTLINATQAPDEAVKETPEAKS